MSNSKKHAGGRKYGRMARKPSHQRYNIEKRWEINKAKKQAKIKKRMEKDTEWEKPIKWGKETILPTPTKKVLSFTRVCFPFTNL